MRITKKLVAETCLPIYYEVMEKSNNANYDTLYQLIHDKKCNSGICYLFNKLTNVAIFDFKELNLLCKMSAVKKCWEGSYYYVTPDCAETKEEMLECIQVRIDLLESWLK